jgi:copper chaperone CopZ
MKNWKRLTFAIVNLLVTALLVGVSQAAGVQRSSYIVSNLSCSSCLATIEAELKGLPGTLGMDADLQRGRVVVDHQTELSYEKIASAITNVGYPAKTDWTATVPDQYAVRYSQRSKFSSGCSSGGCGISGGAGSGAAVWNTSIPADKKVNRTIFQVSNLACTSCFANIEAKLKTMSGTIGMNGDLPRGIVIIDHDSALNGNKIAAAISGLGYPTRIVSTSKITAQKILAEAPRTRRSSFAGTGCNSRKGPCNATSSSWKTLYNRYIGKSNFQQ